MMEQELKYIICVFIMSVLAMAASASSFEINLPIFTKSKLPAKTLYHLDLMNAKLDMRFAMTVLQGLVNREQPRLYISQDPGWHGSGNFQRYIDDLKERGHEIKPITPDEAISSFRGYVNGAVLYDDRTNGNPESLHILNALTLYCAVENLLPVTEEVNTVLKLPVVLDVRGKYTTAYQAYAWAYRSAWPKANKKLLAHTCPTHMVLRDYLVQHKAMPVWISKGMPAKSDGLAQRFLRESEPNSPLMGCWGGYGENPPGRYSEPDLQRIASLYGKFIVVSDGCFNLSVFSGLPYNRPEMKRRPVPKYDPSKVYVVFHITDGDNIQWLQQNFISPQWWHNQSRGKVPISWSLNPVAAELIPNFVEMVQKTATENDEFTCSTAGIGLVTPALYAAELNVDRDAVYNEYLKATDKAMRIIGENCIHLGDTSLVPWTRADFDRCARLMPSVEGILGDYGRMLSVYSDNANYMVSRNVVVLRTLSGVGQGKDDEDRAKSIVRGIKENLVKTRPAFIHVCLVNWYVNPDIVLRAVELLSDDFVPVLPSEAVELYRQSMSERK